MGTIIKKIIALILAMAIFTSLCSGLTFLIANDYRLGMFFTFMLYGTIAVLALFGCLIALMDYIFKD